MGGDKIPLETQNLRKNLRKTGGGNELKGNIFVYPKTPTPLNFSQVKPQVLKQNFRFFKRTKVQQLYHADCHPSLSEMKYFEMK